MLWASYWKYYLAGASVALNILLALGWSHSHGAFVKEQASHQQDINNFEAVQKLADDNAKAQAAALEKKGQDAATKADQDYSSLLAKYNASIVRYKANSGNTAAANYSQLPSAQGGNGSSTSTELPDEVTITSADAEVCAINTARLQAVHDWAIGLDQ